MTHPHGGLHVCHPSDVQTCRPSTTKHGSYVQVRLAATAVASVAREDIETHKHLVNDGQMCLKSFHALAERGCDWIGFTISCHVCGCDIRAQLEP